MASIVASRQIGTAIHLADTQTLACQHIQAENHMNMGTQRQTNHNTHHVPQPKEDAGVPSGGFSCFWLGVKL